MTSSRKYVKLEAYLLQFWCHVTCDVKFGHMLFNLFTLFKRCNLRIKSTRTIKQILICLLKILEHKEHWIEIDQ